MTVAAATEVERAEPMPDGTTAITIHRIGAISEIAAADWDGCAGEANPFVRHGFLAAMEHSGSAVAETGWTPNHLIARTGDGRMAGCVALYLKAHSYGEYVFDWAWAEAFERAGGRYYPKLLSAVPFTPVAGPRLLAHPAAAPGTAEALAAAMVALAERTGVSSLHVNFAEAEDCRQLAAAGMLPRSGLQYHWPNEGYGSFEEFLGALSSRKRKAIRKERASVAACGLVIRALAGPAIEPRHWQAFWSFYRATVAAKWAHAYLTRAFFTRLASSMAEKLVMVVAETPAGRPVAAALNLIGDDAIYGRYWGATVDIPYLHFELCYYRAIEIAIAGRLARVEAGAQGEHKIARGYLPVLTHSAHWIANPILRAGVARFLDAERPAVVAQQQELGALSPYRRDGS